MKTLPDELDESALIGSLAEGWGFAVDVAEYAPLGFGSYHWLVTDAEGRRGFVTVDDLDQKPWLGDTRSARFAGLERAFDTAAALADSGLEFVVAPRRTRKGETVRRLGPRHTVALFPFVEGEAGRFGEDATPDKRAEVVALLVELHRATPAMRCRARTGDLALPGRRELEAALRDWHRPWQGGPLSEPARLALAGHAADVGRLLEAFDRLAAEVAGREGDWVLTHGEPHGGNVLRAGERLLLVDWDTVALAPPERDLWMVLGAEEDEVGLYADATGRRVDHAAIEFFRLTWDLADIAAFLSVLRSPHRETADTLAAYENLVGCLRARGSSS